MQKEPFTIGDMTILNDIVAINKEIVGFLRQRAQHNFAYNETMNIIKKIKAGKIKEINMPSIGNLFIPVKANDKDFNKILREKRDQFKNSLNGIDGQIQHREDQLNELVKKAFLMFDGYIKNNKLKLPNIKEPKPHIEQPSVMEAKKK